MNSVKHHLYMRRHKLGGFLPGLISNEMDHDQMLFAHKQAICMNPKKALEDGLDQIEVYDLGEVELLTGKIEAHEPELIIDCGSLFPQEVKENGES